MSAQATPPGPLPVEGGDAGPGPVSPTTWAGAQPGGVACRYLYRDDHGDHCWLAVGSVKTMAGAFDRAVELLRDIAAADAFEDHAGGFVTIQLDAAVYERLREVGGR